MMTEVNNNPFQSDMDDKPKKRPTKGRVFQCTGFPGCNMSFTRSEHLARHKRKHTGERPFTCPYCSKKFSRLDNLRQHKQTVHAYETFMTKDNISPTQAIPSSNPSTPSDGIFPINDTTSTDSNNNNNNISNHGVPPQNYLPNSLISPPSSRSPHFNHNSNHILYQAPPQPGFYALPQSAMAMKGHSTLSHPHGDYIQHHDAYGQHHPLLLSQEINRPHMTTNSRSYSNSNSDSSLSSSDPVQQSDKNPPEIPPAVLIEKPSNNEYKPKRRPRPLALLDSFAKNSYQIPHMNDSSTSPTNSNFPSALINGANSPYGNYPTLTPNIASPLSPLFHQSFNQTVNKYTNSRISNLNNSLRIPPIINSTANSKWLKDVLNNDKNSKIIPHNIEVKPESNEATISNPEEKDTPTEVLIESAEISTDTAVTTSASLTEGKSSTANKVNHTSKKPTINSLLSPNQTETFPEKISSRSSNYPALPSVQE